MTGTIVQIVLPPETNALIERYQAIIDDIYAKASREMECTPLRTQAMIHRNAIEVARPFREEIGRIRAMTLPSFIVKTDKP